MYRVSQDEKWGEFGRMSRKDLECERIVWNGKEGAEMAVKETRHTPPRTRKWQHVDGLRESMTWAGKKAPGHVLCHEKMSRKSERELGDAEIEAIGSCLAITPPSSHLPGSLASIRELGTTECAFEGVQENAGAIEPEKEKGNARALERNGHDVGRIDHFDLVGQRTQKEAPGNWGAQERYGDHDRHISGVRDKDLDPLVSTSHLSHHHVPDCDSSEVGKGRARAWLESSGWGNMDETASSLPVTPPSIAPSRQVNLSVRSACILDPSYTSWVTKVSEPINIIIMITSVVFAVVIILTVGMGRRVFGRRTVA